MAEAAESIADKSMVDQAMIAMPPSLTMADARESTDALVAAVAAAPGSRVVLDATGLQQLDTAAVATVLACRRAAQAAGKSLALHNAPKRLSKLAALYGVAELLSLAPPSS